MTRSVFGALVLLAAAMIAPGVAFSADFNRLYAFGDSYSDIGAGYLAGNGPTSVAYLAQRMHLPFTHSKDQNANSESIDFAVAGAATGLDAGRPQNGLWLQVGMINQVQDFVQRVHDKSISFDPDRTLFFIAGGLNDDDVPLDVSVANMARQIELLHSVGARHIVLARLPEKIPGFAQVAQRLNPAYEKLVPALREKLGIDLWLSEWGRYFDEVIDHPKAYGITNSKDPCAFSAPLGEKGGPPCKHPREYFYYYGDHPSTWVNKRVGNELYDEVRAHRSPSA